MNILKVLFVGLGSIGTRHLKNLSAIAKEQDIDLVADALRSSDRPLPEETTRLLFHQYFTEDEVPSGYDVVFITNPTNLHFDAIQKLGAKGEALFIEKPLFEDDHYALKDCGLENKKAYIACPMRWCGTFIELKKALQNEQVYSTRVICSSYLPEWRKGVDYRNVYSAKKEMGGGVSIDLIHEWDYLVDLFGMPLEVCNFQGTYSHLEITSDDISVYIARFANQLAEVHLDYFGRSYRRTAEFFVHDGTMIADFGSGTLTLANGTMIDCIEDVNERYMREMRYFLQYIKGEVENINPPQLALQVLTVAEGKKV